MKIAASVLLFEAYLLFSHKATNICRIMDVPMSEERFNTRCVLLFVHKNFYLGKRFF